MDEDVSTVPAARGLIGRGSELRRIAGLLEQGRHGGAALLLEGAVGTGKTALLDAAAAAAEEQGWRVLRCAGSTVETGYSYAALHELLYPVLSEAGALAERHRSAVSAAFGDEDTGVPDAYATSLAVLELLRSLAASAPLLIVADDVQWMDARTVATLTFVARRLTATPAVLLFGCRTRKHDSLPEFTLARLSLTPLEPAAAAALLDRQRPPLSGRLRDRVLAQAAGNPLALLELPRALSSVPAVDCSLPPHRLPLTERLRRAFTAETAALPAPTRMLLLLAAAEPLSPTELASAARRLGSSLDHLAPAEREGVVTFPGDRLVFGHPLLGSALYAGASLADRVTVHRKLADVLAADPSRAAWHRACGTIGPDESAAADLQAHAGSVEALALAAELSPDTGDRARRLALAAEAARSRNHTVAMRRLLTEARRYGVETTTAGALRMTEAAHRRAIGAPTVRDSGDLVALARRVAGSDGEAAGELLACAAVEATVDVPPAGWATEVEDALLALHLPADHPLRVLTLGLLAPRRYAPELGPALRRLAPPPPGRLLRAAMAAERLHETETAHRWWTLAVDTFRTAGEPANLVPALCGLARSEMAAGRLSDAAEVAERASRVAADQGPGPGTAMAAQISAQLLAWQGETVAAAEALAHARDRCSPGFPAAVRAGLSRTEGMVALAHGRAEQAYAAFLDVVTPGTASHHPSAAEQLIADLAESAVLAGLAAEAAPVVDRLSAATLRFADPMVRMQTFRARALLATATGGSDDADAWFRRALAEQGTGSLLLEAARTRLCYGRWLRHSGQFSTARTHLKAALAGLATAGAQLWCRRAETELRGAGGATPKHPVLAIRGSRPLTSQETEVARLAAAGLTNPEIAERLFLSRRTVAVHLYNAYPKLGVRSRRELSDVLVTRPGSAASGRKVAR